jgi:hypothetical protein
MEKILLVDFGASRIKAVVWSFVHHRVIEALECEAPIPKIGSGGEIEIEPEQYWSGLVNTAGILLDRHPNIERMWLCAEMHGVLLLDALTYKPLTSYISWRDERASKAISGQPATFSQFDDKNFQDAFLGETGLKLRVGLPFVTLAHLHEVTKDLQDFKVCTLVDWILYRGGEKSPKVHPSLAAGMGFYSLSDCAWSDGLIQKSSSGLHAGQFSEPSKLSEKIGQISIGKHSLAVYGGLGDMQAAIFGAGFPKKGSLLVNLGTGSQVVGDTFQEGAGVERRLGANAEVFAALTHIPAGRSLNVFAKFIDGASLLGGGQPVFWKIFSTLDPDEILGSSIMVDLNVFEASWRYETGGLISGINENTFEVRPFIAGLVKSWLSQYKVAMDLIDPGHIADKFLISGGLSRRGSFVLPVLEKLSGRFGCMAKTITGEETLDGLLALALEHNEA